MKKISKKTKRLLINLAFVAVLFAITLVVLFVSQKDDLDFKQIREYFTDSNPVWIVMAFVCMLLFTFFEGVSIFFIARFFGRKPNIVSCTAYSAANGFYSAITPTAAGGQPAAVYYMSRDGMSPGKASFAILLNTIGYTGAIFAIGIAALCINAPLFGGINEVFAKVLVVAGAVIQLGLLGLYIGCMFFGKAIIKCGNGIVWLLNKMHIVKHPDKWREKIEYEVERYGECRQILKDKPLVLVTTLIFNILQRVSQTLIPCFVCLAVDPNAPFLDIFVLQAFVLFGYNSVPLPGGVGAYEYLFMNIYGQLFPDSSFLLLVLMISRLFSYYLSLIVSGVITLTYHMVKVKKEEALPQTPLADGETEAVNSPDAQIENAEKLTDSSENATSEDNQSSAQNTENNADAVTPKEKDKAQNIETTEEDNKSDF